MRNKLIQIGRRLAQALPSVFGVIVISFVLTRALPGDPAVYFAGDMADKESIEQVRQSLGASRMCFGYSNGYSVQHTTREPNSKPLFQRVAMVGKTGFEPATPCSQSRCATKLRHFPVSRLGYRPVGEHGPLLFACLRLLR